MPFRFAPAISVCVVLKVKASFYLLVGSLESLKNLSDSGFETTLAIIKRVFTEVIYENQWPHAFSTNFNLI